MKLFGGLIRYLRRSRAEKERRKELQLRMQLSEARREADALHRGAEKAKKEAARLEHAGKHEAAVSKALEAKRKETMYLSALKNVDQCEGVYEQSKAHKATIKAMETFKDLSESVMEEVDMEKAERLTAEMQEVVVRLDQTQESLTAFQEGFAPTEDNAVRNLAGEEALADILAAEVPAAAPDEEPVAPAVIEASAAPAEAAEGGEDQLEWLNAQRRKLAELA